MLNRGEIVHGRYRIERPLGQGGMGSVFLAVDTGSGRSVAVKALRARSAEARRQFELEARILTELAHPNLPRVHGLFLHGDTSCLVMDFIPGRSLDEVIAAERTGLPEARVLEWARHLCDVLEYLHGHRPPVIFRDLKPSNVILLEHDRIKLIDFGIAKIEEDARGGGTQTVAKGVVSRGFAPPEQYGGGTDARSDIYSLGATLYCLLTGEIPPESVDLATRRAVLKDARTLRPDLSARTAAALEAMMAVDRDLRPPTVAKVREALGLVRVSTPSTSLQDMATAPRPGVRNAAAPPTTRPGLRPAAGPPTTRPAPVQAPPSRPRPAEPVRASAAGAHRRFSLPLLITCLLLVSAGIGALVTLRLVTPAGADAEASVAGGSRPLRPTAVGAGPLGPSPGPAQGSATPDAPVVQSSPPLASPRPTSTPLPPRPMSTPTPVPARPTTAARPPAPRPTPTVAARTPARSPQASPPIVDVPPPPAATPAPARPSVAPEDTAADGDGRRFEIRAGEGVGPLVLGQPSAQLARVGREVDVDGARATFIRRVGVAVLSHDGRIDRIYVRPLPGSGRNGLCHTSAGTVVGDPASRVVDEFGPPQDTVPYRGGLVWRYPERGIAFRIRDERIVGIEVFAR